MKFPERIISQLNEPGVYKDISKPDRLHIVRRTAENQYLTVLGSHHDTNANQPYYDGAYFCFEDWENMSHGRPRLIIAEGEQDLWGKDETLRYSIEKHYSEVGWLCFLADAYDIPIISGEPPNYGEIVQLIKDGYSPTELLLYYGIREIPLWHRMKGDKEDFIVYMERVFAIYQRKLGKLALTNSLPDLDFSLPAFFEGYKNHFDDLPDPQSKEMNELYLKYTSAEKADEAFSQLPIARVAKRVMDLRNAYLGATYEKHWQNGESIFSWYGMDHTLALGKCLHCLGRRLEIPHELARGFSFQEGHIYEASSAAIGPDTVQDVIKKNLAARQGQAPEWPYWLLEPNNPPSSSEDCTRIKNRFEERVKLPISASFYILYLTQPERHGDPSHIIFFKELETYADEHINIDAAQYIEMLHLRSNMQPCELEATKRLFAAFTSHDMSLFELLDFKYRIEELRSLVIITTYDAGYEYSDAMLTYNTLSKHVAAIFLLLIPETPRRIPLSATEYLQYSLEVLDHSMSSDTPFPFEEIYD